MSFTRHHRHIKVPIYGVQKLYSWEEGVEGIGLLKSWVDGFQEDETLYIGYGENRQIIYTIKVAKVKQYPIHDIPSYKNAQTYVVKSTDLNKSKMTKNNYEVKDMCENGTFG